MSSKVWVYWNKGWDNVPPVVQFCKRSWEKYSGDREIVYLTDANIKQYLDVDFFPKNIRKAPVQAYSDYLRISLIEEHGGVWLDSTTFLTKPLDDWLPDYLKAWNLFLFSNVRPDRKIASWFIAGDKEHEAVVDWKAKCDAYWMKHTKPHEYFWFHHLFHDVLEEQDFKYKWANVIKHDAKTPRWYNQEAMYANNPAYFAYFKDHKAKLNEIDPVIENAIANGVQSPVYKFDKGLKTNTKMFGLLKDTLL